MIVMTADTSVFRAVPAVEEVEFGLNPMLRHSTAQLKV